MAGSMRAALLLAAVACCLAQQLPQTGAGAASAAQPAAEEQALIASLPGYSSYYKGAGSSHYNASHSATLHGGSHTLGNVVVEQHAEVNVKADGKGRHKSRPVDYDSYSYGEDADAYKGYKHSRYGSKYGSSQYPKHAAGDDGDDDTPEAEYAPYKGGRKHGKHGYKHSGKHEDKESPSYPKKHHAGEHKGAYAPKASPSPSPAPPPHSYAPKPSPSPSPEHHYLYRPAEESEEQEEQPPVHKHHKEQKPEHTEPPAEHKRPEEERKPEEDKPEDAPESYAEDKSGYPDLSHRVCIQEFQRDIIPRVEGDTEKCLNVSQPIKFLSHVSCCKRDEYSYFSDEAKYGGGKHVYDNGVAPPPVNIGHCTWTVTPNALRQRGYVTEHAQRQSATVEALCEFTTPAASECIPFGDFRDGGSVSFRVKHGYWYRTVGAIMAPQEYAYSHANQHTDYKVEEEEPFWLPNAKAKAQRAGAGQALTQDVQAAEAAAAKPADAAVAATAPKAEAVAAKPAEAAVAATTSKAEAAAAAPKPAQEASKQQAQAAAPSDAAKVGVAAANNFFFSDEALQQQPAKRGKQREHYNREGEDYSGAQSGGDDYEGGGGYEHAELEAHRGVGDLFMGHISHVQQHANAGDYYGSSGYDGGYAATAAAAGAAAASSNTRVAAWYGGAPRSYGSGYGSAIKGVEGGILEFVAGFVDEEGAVLYPTDTGCTDWAEPGSRDSQGKVPLLLAGAAWLQFEDKAEQYYSYGDSHEEEAYHDRGYTEPRD